MTTVAAMRTNTPAHPFPRTGPPQGAASEFANDPFIQRIAGEGGAAAARRDVRSRADIVAGLKHLNHQRERAELADEMYEGTVGMVYASRQVRKLLSRQGVDDGDIEDFNYAKKPVDVIADRLQVAAVKVAPKVDEDDAEGDEGDDTEGDGEKAGSTVSADEKTLRRAARAIERLDRVNRLDVYRKDLFKKVSLHGDAYLFLWPVTDARGRVVSVDMRVNSAHNVAFIYDMEDPLQVSYVIKSWKTEVDRRDVYRANLYYPGPPTIGPDGDIVQGAGRVERWTTEPGTNPEVEGNWVRVHRAQDIEQDDIEDVAADEFGDADEPLDKDDIPSPFGLTWFHFRNDVPCGRPEHVSAYGPQKMINKLVWSLAGVIEYLGFPQRWIMVDPKIDDPLLNVVDPDHPEGDDDPENEGGNSGLRSEPNEVWRLFGKATGQYSAADPDTFLKPLDRFITAMSELTSLPRYAFTKASADLPSGEAIRGLNGELLATIGDRQRRYDPELQDAYELALRMLGIEGVAVDVRWEPASMINDKAGLDVLEAKGRLGVPSEVLLNEAGYPDDQIGAWLSRQDGLSLEQRVTLLVQLGTAVQALAAGVTAGVVSDNQMQAFIARIVGNLADGTHEAEPEEDPLPTPTFRDPPPIPPAGGFGAPGAADGPGGTPARGQPAKKATAAPARRPAGTKATTPAKKAAPAKKTAGTKKTAAPAGAPVRAATGG